jgi:hypothetical protein
MLAMPLIVHAEPIPTREEIERDLPQLWRPEHAPDGIGGWEVAPLTWRCPHGVYVAPYSGLTQERHLHWVDADQDWDSDDVWLSLYCSGCYPEYARLQLSRDGIDSRDVRPEVFTQEILRRGRTLTSDLRLSVDPETGEPRLENMHGYVADGTGYRKVNRVLSDETNTTWTATMPGARMLRNYEVIFVPATKENWFPPSLPIVHRPLPAPNPATFVTFAAKEEEVRCSRTIARPCGRGFYASSAERKAFAAAKTLAWVGLDKHPVRKPGPRHGWPFSPAEQPSEKELITWRSRHGTKPHRIAPKMPLRRTPRWEDDWRDERKMQDIAANLNMYKYGAVNRDPETLPDIPCRVAQRMTNGGTREIQIEKMLTTAAENYRKARVEFSRRFGARRG